jgi:hypothetical protein
MYGSFVRLRKVARGSSLAFVFFLVSFFLGSAVLGGAARGGGRVLVLRLHAITHYLLCFFCSFSSESPVPEFLEFCGSHMVDNFFFCFLRWILSIRSENFAHSSCDMIEHLCPAIGREELSGSTVGSRLLGGLVASIRTCGTRM